MNKMMIDPHYFKEYLKAFADTSLQIYEQAPSKVSIGAIKWDKKYRVGVTVNSEFEANEVRQLIEAAPYLYAALVDLERFAELVRDDEREANAKLCEELARQVGNKNYIAVDQRQFCAKQIRAKGNHGQD